MKNLLTFQVFARVKNYVVSIDQDFFILFFGKILVSVHDNTYDSYDILLYYYHVFCIQKHLSQATIGYEYTLEYPKACSEFTAICCKQ